jgi:cytidylate kinase
MHAWGVAMYRIITVEREFGSGGAEIACALSKQLGWQLWDRSLTEEIAKIANVECATVERCEERADGAFQRLVKVFLRGSHEHSMPGNELFDTDRFVAVGEQVMQRIARTGNCVIVGRGAPYFLRDRDDVFHVFLYASHEEKMRRLRRLGKRQAEIAELLNTVDRDRITFVKRYFNADWPTRCLYHLMINTAIGNEIVLATILNTMHALQHSEVPVTR